MLLQWKKRTCDPAIVKGLMEAKGLMTLTNHVFIYVDIDGCDSPWGWAYASVSPIRNNCNHL